MLINKVDIDLFRKTIGKKTQIHKVAHFFKDDMELSDKTIILADFEFTTQYNIHEVTLIKVINGKIIDIWFEEFKVPSTDTIFDFNFKRAVKIPRNFNSDKNIFSSDKKEKLLNMINEADFFVAHNYIAELQCIHKLQFPDLKYDVTNIDIFNQGKIICTNKSFNNKYFKQDNLFTNGFSNENVSSSLGWNVQYRRENKKFVLDNKRLGTSIVVDKLPDNFLKSKTNVGIHNSLFDTLITYTSFLSLNEFV